MESERKTESGNKKKKGAKVGGLGERMAAVKSGRVRKPKRGNRAGAGRHRTHKNNSPENREVGNGNRELRTENKVKRKRTDECAREVTTEGGKAADWGKAQKTTLEEASQNGKLQASAALPEPNKSKRKKKKSKNTGAVQQVCSAVVEADQRTEPTKHSLKSLSYLEKMRARLSGGRFRMLNESLYTCKGDEAFELFQQDPGAFDLYHTGYQEQMSRWPVLPVTVVTKWLQSRSTNLVVADFGCGDARLAKSVKNKVISMDLVSSDPSVIACNMAKTPLETLSVDVAVFCLSLMGTDYPKFLEEAHRVLRSRGWLLIAEVKSRLDAGNGGAGPKSFVSAIRSLGFVLDSQDDSSKMFHMFYFQKEGSKHESKQKIHWPELKPCIYKRR